jgi:anti-sigma regulatory factor (Ser/Thr protein kinase)
LPASPAEPATFRRAIRLTPQSLDAAQDELATWLAARQVPAPAAYRLRLVLDELLANLMMHGHFTGPPSPVRLVATVGAAEIDLTLDDAARPFDPRAAPEPLRPTLAGDKLGGLGLALVRKMAEIRDYRRLPEGLNRTELSIPLQVAAGD